MKKLMRVAHTFMSPKGPVISGTNPQVDGLAEAVVMLALNSVRHIEVRGRDSKCILTVNGFEMTTSVGGGKNLHFLVQEADLADSVAEGDGVFADGLECDLWPEARREER